MKKIIVMDEKNWYENFSDFRASINEMLNKSLSRPLRWKPINHMYYGIASANFENAAIFSLKVDQDLHKAKQYLYFSELCKIRQYLEFSKGANSILQGVFPDFMRAPLSGSSHLYDFFAKMNFPHALIQSQSAVSRMLIGYGAMQQAAMIKDHVRLARELEKFEIACKEDPKVDNVGVIDFYYALINNNSDGVEKALMLLLEPKSFKKRQRDYAGCIPGRFMAWVTMWCAKVAWINGHEIEINHPHIISELLPDTSPFAKFTSEENPYPFLIDPVLENMDFWHYGGERSNEEVEKHNQTILHDRIPAKYDGVKNFVQLPLDE